MLEKNELLSLPKFELHKGFFVYFLFKGKDVVYVGQTTESVEARVGTHSKTKDFDSYSFLELSNALEALKMEFEYIVHLSPKYNAKITYCPPDYLSENYVWVLLHRIRERTHINNDKVKHLDIAFAFKGTKYYFSSDVEKLTNLSYQEIYNIISQ